MIDEKINPWKTETQKIVYENKWITLSHNEVKTPTETDGIYGKVHFKNYAIGIIPIDTEGFTYLVGQYRYAINAYSWEIPEGGSLLNDNILDAAKRELKEETGLIATKWTLLANAYTSNSATNESATIFIAQDLEQTIPQPDETEQLQIKKVSLVEAFEMAMTGQITDAISIIALLKLKILIDEGKFEI